MSDSLFLPRELFEPDTAASGRPSAMPVVTVPAAHSSRRSVQFASGAEVAADLLQAMRETPAFVERRRKPRTANPLHISR